MCKLVEDYANDRAMDAVINLCFRFHQTTGATIEIIKEEFPEADNDKIIERVKFLWYQKKREEGRAEGRIQGLIESAVEYDRPKEETIARLVKKFSLTEEQAKEYYNMYAPQPV